MVICFSVSQWSSGAWSNCSKPCGFSTKYRLNKCKTGCAKFGKNKAIVKEYTLCNVNDCGNYGMHTLEIRF